MSMSLDGFITGPDDGPGNGLENGGHRLHEWLGEPEGSGCCSTTVNLTGTRRRR